MPVGVKFSSLLSNPLVDILLGTQAAGALASAYNEHQNAQKQGDIDQSLVQGSPVTSTPRTGISGLIAKTGLISPNATVDPATQAAEKLALQGQQERALGTVGAARSQLGPGIAKAPGFANLLNQAGLTPESVAQPNLREQTLANTAKRQADTDAERVRHDKATEQTQEKRLTYDKGKPDIQAVSSTVQDADGTNHIVIHEIDKKTGAIKTVYDAKAGTKGSGMSLKDREELAAFSAKLKAGADLNKTLEKPLKIGDSSYKGEISTDPATGKPAIKWTNQTPGIEDKVMGSAPIYTSLNAPAPTDDRPSGVGADWTKGTVKGKPAWISPDKKQASFIGSGS